jgi:hypothetical protein
MTTCDEVRDHLEDCDECRLHVAVEARLRSQPLLEPPRGLVARAMKALPRAVSFRRELLRLAAAAAVLAALGSGLLASSLMQDSRVVTVREGASQVLRSAAASVNAWRSETWWR